MQIISVDYLLEHVGACDIGASHPETDAMADDMPQQTQKYRSTITVSEEYYNDVVVPSIQDHIVPSITHVLTGLENEDH